MIYRVQLKREAQRRVLFAPERSPSAIVNGGVSKRHVMSARWQSRALRIVLVAPPLALLTASGAHAQVFGPTSPGSPITTTVEVFSPTNSPVTVVGNTMIATPGDAFDAPPYAEEGGSLTIDTESTNPAVPGSTPGPISITSGGSGVASVFPSSPATISINSGASGDITITSSGATLGISGNSSLTAIGANGGHLMLESTGSEVVVAQFGAIIDVTGATISRAARSLRSSLEAT